MLILLILIHNILLPVLSKAMKLPGLPFLSIDFQTLFRALIFGMKLSMFIIISMPLQFSLGTLSLSPVSLRTEVGLLVVRTKDFSLLIGLPD